MKSVFGFLIIGIFFLCSCGSDGKFKVGFLFPNMKSDRYIKEKVYFTEKINELGGEAIITSADYDDKLQIQQAQELLNQGVKVIVVNSVNQNTAAAIVRYAHDKDVKVIAYDRMIGNCDLDYYLSFDNVKVGKLMAEYAVKLKPEGDYLLFGGDKADKNAIYVKRGQLEVLDPYIKSNKIKILYDIYVEDWSGENAKYDIKRYLDLSLSKPDVILSSYDGMSTGIIEALKDYNYEGQIIITGQDAELAACKNIVAGYQNMTVYKPLKKMAYTAAELCKKIINNENISEATTSLTNGYKEVPAILLEPITVDKNNLKSTVIADGFIKESDLY